MNDHDTTTHFDELVAGIDPAQPDPLRARALVDHDVCRELAELHELIAAPAALVPPASLRPELFSRIFDTIRASSRYEAFVPQVATLLDVSHDRARTLLDGIDRSECWEDSPFPGVRLYHLEGGANLDDAIAGFVSIPPGQGFPEHHHLGTEHFLVIQGSIVDFDGVVLRPGELRVMDGGTAHAIRVPPTSMPLVALSIIHGGVRIGDIEMLPGDPNI